MEKRKHSLVDNADEKRYEFDLGDDIAIIEYIKTQGFIILTHTEVPEKYEGQGIGAELVHDVLEDLRAKKIQMIPQCPFVAQYIRRHPEWVDVVLKEIPAKETGNPPGGGFPVTVSQAFRNRPCGTARPVDPGCWPGCRA